MSTEFSSHALAVSRRTVLAAGAGSAGVLALAACAGGGGSSAAPPAHVTADKALTALSGVEVGRCKAVSLPDGSPAIVARPTASTAVCFSAICTHAGCTVAPNGAQLDCPCHGSRYNALTGAVINGPASRPLAKIAVKVSNGDVLTA